MSTDRTTPRLTDERKQKLDHDAAIVTGDDNDDPPMSDVIDAALTHLIGSEQNIDVVRGECPPGTIQEIAKTSVLSLHYRASIDSRWR